MLLELNKSYKYPISNHPSALPNKCVGCGIGHDNDGKIQFIDTGQELDYYGVIYFCTSCFVEIAESLGFPAPEKWKLAEATIDNLTEYVVKLEGENEGLRDAVNLLTGHRCHEPIPSPTSMEDEGGSENDGPISPTPEGVESAEPEPDSSNSEPGLSDLRGPAKSKQPSKSDDPLAEFDV